MPSNSSVQNALKQIENDASKVLGLSFAKHTNIQPGQYIPKQDAQSPPALSLSSLSPTKTYMVVGLDIDAPFPSFGALGPILHWIQPGLQLSTSSENSDTSTLEATAPFVANYIGPAPPPWSSPHRYIFFLYEQPEGFDVKKYAPPNDQNLGNMQRMWYSLDGWEEEASLGPILASNYFTSN